LKCRKKRRTCGSMWENSLRNTATRSRTCARCPARVVWLTGGSGASPVRAGVHDACHLVPQGSVVIFRLSRYIRWSAHAAARG
jgi:hypothetical protein